MTARSRRSAGLQVVAESSSVAARPDRDDASADGAGVDLSVGRPRPPSSAMSRTACRPNASRVRVTSACTASLAADHAARDGRQQLRLGGRARGAARVRRAAWSTTTLTSTAIDDVEDERDQVRRPPIVSV